MIILATRKQEQNEAWFDPWSVVHFATGLAFGLTGVSFWKTFAAGIAWDVFEQYFERTEWGQRLFKTSGPESWGNVGADLALFLSGWKLGDMWNETGPAVNPSRRSMRERRANAQAKNFGRLTRSSKPKPRGERHRSGASSPSFRDQVAGSINLFP